MDDLVVNTTDITHMFRPDDQILRIDAAVILARALDHILDKSDCDSNGGKWMGSPYGINYCSYPTSDGGKVCTDSNQCEAFCIIEDWSSLTSAQIEGTENVTGICQYYTHVLSCMTEVVNSKAQATICY